MMIDWKATTTYTLYLYFLPSPFVGGTNIKIYWGLKFSEKEQ
mgnify:CR=1 FL=1